jgi:hypothetical protein
VVGVVLGQIHCLFDESSVDWVAEDYLKVEMHKVCTERLWLTERSFRPIAHFV